MEYLQWVTYPKIVKVESISVKRIRIKKFIRNY